MTIGSSNNFNIVNLTVDVRKINLLDKVNLHMQTGQLILNDLTKTNAIDPKAENMLWKFMKKLKLEKSNSNALTTQNEELKKIIVKIRVDPKDRSTMQKLLQSAESKIFLLKKKLKLPTGEHSMAAEVVEVESEKESLLQQLLQKEEEISKLKETVLKLQSQIDSHSCTIIMPFGNDDPAAQLSQLNIELKMANKYLKKAQNDLETVTKIMQAKDGEIDKYRTDCQTANAEIKSLKEKLKGNINLIQAKDII